MSINFEYIQAVFDLKKWWRKNFGLAWMASSSSTSAFCEEYLGELAELIVSGCDAGPLSEVPNSAKLQQILAQIKRKRKQNLKFFFSNLYI